MRTSDQISERLTIDFIRSMESEKVFVLSAPSHRKKGMM
jgi:hypothetical protein